MGSVGCSVIHPGHAGACLTARREASFVAATPVRLVPILLLMLANAALANPTGPQVRGGSATITTAGPIMTVTSPQGAVIDWQGFAVGAGETVRFVQPEGSTVINRVTGGGMGLVGSVQTSGRVLFLQGGSVSGAGVSGDLGVMTAASLHNSALAPPTGVQPRDLAARAAQALKQGQAFVIGPRGTTLATARDNNIMLSPGRGAELGDRRLPFVRVLVVAPADKPLDLDALVAARPNGIFNALFLPPIPASTTRGDAPTALAAVDATGTPAAEVRQPVVFAMTAMAAKEVPAPVALVPADIMPVQPVQQVQPVVVELRVAMLERLPEERVLAAVLAPVEELAGKPVLHDPAPVENRVIVVWAAPVEERVTSLASVLVQPAAPVEDWQWALKEFAKAEATVVTSAVSPAMVQVAVRAQSDQPPVKLAAIQRRMPRIFFDYRGAVYHM
jgi:filamentous hemagglutinin family protein